VSIRFFDTPFSRSVSLHLLLLLILICYSILAPKIELPSQPISVSIVEPNFDQSKSKAIVQPTEGKIVKEAVKDAYLSDRNRVVESERSATKIGAMQAGAPQKEETSRSQARSFKLSDFGVKISTLEKKPPEKAKNWASNALGEAVKGGQYMQGLKEGETSALNTKEFVFFSYFERVRRQLDQTWQPLVRGQIDRIYKSGRHLASETDFVTRTLITINIKGEIVRVQLLQESGAVDLDAAAINALNRAGPYPNPPKGLLDDSGNAQIRWDFVLKT
jgi:TonB family protein